MTFHVGQKVICVSDADWDFLWSIPKPEVGSIYTIKSLELPILSLGEDEMGLLLECVIHPLYPFIEGVHIAYKASRFAPLQEKGMSILRSIAANSKRELEVVE